MFMYECKHCKQALFHDAEKKRGMCLHCALFPELRNRKLTEWGFENPVRKS